MTRRKRTKSSPTTLAGLIGIIIVIAVVELSRLIEPGVSTSTPTAAPGTPTLVITATPFIGPTLPSVGTSVASVPNGLTILSVPQGFGAQRSFWRVYFDQPSSSDKSTYTTGINTALVADLGATQRTVDIAAYEFNDPLITRAVLDAHARGVRVRVVTDDNDGLGDADTTLHQLVDAGIPVVTDGRSALMHNKFMILDSTTVWTGTWNYTVNDTFRNNNNALVLRSQKAVADYQAEFDEMFVDHKFGPTSPANTPYQSFTQDGVPIQIYFAPEDKPVPAMTAALAGAGHKIRFMTFSFTIDSIGQVLIERAKAGVAVEGIFETTGSETRASELTPLFCAGLAVRQDGNPYILHHKVFIIDDVTVITGSFNISANATDSNDENLVIITDPDLAAQYTAEFDRRWAEAVKPTRLTC